MSRLIRAAKQANDSASEFVLQSESSMSEFELQRKATFPRANLSCKAKTIFVHNNGRGYLFRSETICITKAEAVQVEHDLRTAEASQAEYGLRPVGAVHAKADLRKGVLC